MNKYKIVKFVNNEIELDVNVSPNEETVWLDLDQISKLFNRDRSVITRHVKNIFQEEELNKDSVCAFFAHTASDNKTYTKLFYNLDMIISIGYRVKSKNGIIFRKWAISILKEYLLKGYAISNRAIITKDNYLALTNKVIELDKDVNYIKNEIKLINPESQIFYSGEYYKSYVFINKIIKEAKNKLIIIDPYLDSNIFEYLKLIDKKIKCFLIHSDKSKIIEEQINNFIKLGFTISTRIDNTYHDRFIVIDNKVIYHIGTSFNYLGNKTFLINKVDDEPWVNKFIKNIKI